MGADATRVFHAGGTIGRSPDNDWVLPDPERFVSSQHAVISQEGGGYVLTDCSTNGTIVNGRELAKGGRVSLGTGDLVTIGSYEISVLVDAAPAAQASAPGAAGRLDAYLEPEAASVPGAESSVDPLDFFADAGDVAVPQGPAAAPDHSSAHSDFFAPPPVAPDPRMPGPARSPAPPAPSPAAVGGAGAIPENWDETGFSATSPPPAPPARPASGPPPPQAPVPESWSDADPFAPPGPVPGGASGSPPKTEFLGQPGQFEAPPVAPAARTSDAGASGVRSRPSAPPPQAPLPPSRPAARPRAAGPAQSVGAPPPGPGRSPGDVTALLRAAGIDPATVDAATLASLGDILRVVVEGLMEVLRARAEIKNQFRVAMTTLKPVENNPLKFSANPEDALFNLFGRRGQSFKAPVDAFREAFDDLKAHQIASMAGMRAAFTALLGRFDPDRLQEGFDRGLKRGALLDVMNKTKYWDLYREMYNELGDDDATFRRLFGDEFAQAYEEQMQRLTALQRRR